MKQSNYFQSFKTHSQKPDSLSHTFFHMMRSGMIHQNSTGLFTWLPYGTSLVQNIMGIIRKVHNNYGCLEVIAPILQDSLLWEKTGRIHSYGKEMFFSIDRHNHKMIYSPTCEELFTHFSSYYIQSYRDLPMVLYQFQWKFRDEIRPRGGVLRSKEFLMKDAYSFCHDNDSVIDKFFLMTNIYREIFNVLECDYIFSRASSGEMGGNMSCEFIIPSEESGDVTVFYDDSLDYKNHNDIIRIIQEDAYSTTEDVHDGEKFNTFVHSNHQKSCKGVEIAHVFTFNDLYSRVFDLSYNDISGCKKYVHMGSYGIGVTRLVFMLVESFLRKDNFYLPAVVAPFIFHIVNLYPSCSLCTEACEKLYKNIPGTCLYDDSHNSSGYKLHMSDILGCPYQINCGKKFRESRLFEFCIKKDNTRELLDIDCIKNICYEKVSEKFIF